VGHRKKHPTSRNFIIMGEKKRVKRKTKKSSRLSSITKAQVSPKNTHPTSRNFWVVREKVSPADKFPICMDFKVKKKKIR